MSLGKYVFTDILCIIQTLAYFVIFSASELENLQERNSGWKVLEPLSTALANLGPFGTEPRAFSFSLNGVVCEGLTTVCLHPSSPALFSRQSLLLFLSHCER